MPEVIPVATYAGLISDEHLKLKHADAIATALDRIGDDVHVVYLPKELAEQNTLEPEDGTDSVFVVEFVSERETDDAYYARQGLSGAWLPKSATRVYVETDGADILVPNTGQETEGSA